VKGLHNLNFIYPVGATPTNGQNSSQLSNQERLLSLEIETDAHARDTSLTNFRILNSSQFANPVRRLGLDSHDPRRRYDNEIGGDLGESGKEPKVPIETKMPRAEVEAQMSFNPEHNNTWEDSLNKASEG